MLDHIQKAADDIAAKLQLPSKYLRDDYLYIITQNRGGNYSTWTQEFEGIPTPALVKSSFRFWKMELGKQQGTWSTKISETVWLFSADKLNAWLIMNPPKE